MRRLITSGLALLCACQGGKGERQETSCTPASAATGGEATGATVSVAQRAAIEDTLRKLNDVSIAAQNRRDLDALMRLVPDSGMIMVSDGMILTTADSLRTVMRQLWAAPWLRDLKLTNGIKRIDVLGPNAAVVTTTSTTDLDSAGKKVTFHNVWTGAWENRGGRWVVVQQHSSMVPGGT